MKKNAKKKPAQSGQSLVEFALALTLMLTLVAGAVDLGSAFFAYIALRDAAQEGALYGSIAAVVEDPNGTMGVYDAGEPLNTAAIINRVRQSSDQPVDLTDVTNVTVAVSATNPPCAGGGITVTVAYNYQITMPFIGAIIGSQTIPVRASVTNTILKPACP
ncbi:MAG: TadE family protein [Anaerolineaceae bacterium]|nr:MAG: TadE family protein [Anaerolineaceae bacterium]